MSKTYLGVDIGTSELHLTVVNGNNVRCLPPEPIPNNLVRDGRVVSAETMAQLLRTAVKKHRIATRSCALVLPPEMVFTRRVTMPYMTIEQLDINLPYEFHDYIQKDKDMYFYDYAVISVGQDEEGKPKSLDLLAAAVTKDVIQEYRRLLSRAGLKLELAMPESFAYRNLILEHEKTAGKSHPAEYCIVDMGHAATRIHMFQGGAYETTRVLDFGGAVIDTLIADSLDVDTHVATSYKVRNHENVQELEPCRELYGRIAVEIVRAINFYGYNNPNSNLQDVYFCGGLTRIEGLMQTIRETVELQLHDIRELMPVLSEEENAERCPVAVGVTLQ